MARVLKPPRRGSVDPLKPGDGLQLGRQYRAQSIRWSGQRDEGQELHGRQLRGIVDAEARTVRFPFSSEFPGARWWGMEVLGHGERDTIRWDRFEEGAAVLLQHDIRELVGVTSNPELVVNEARGWVTARFSRKQLAGETFADIEDDVIRSVSFAYEIWKLREIEPPENAEQFDPGAAPRDEGDLVLDWWWGPVPVGDLGEARWFRVTDWEPLEVSFVSIPLDPTVGVGREAAEALERSGHAGRIHPVNVTWREESLARGPSATRSEEGMTEEQRRAIRKLAKRLGLVELGEKAIEKGWTLEEFQAKTTDAIAEQRDAEAGGDDPPARGADTDTPPAAPAERGGDDEETVTLTRAEIREIAVGATRGEDDRATEIANLGRTFGLNDLASEAVRERWTVARFRKRAMEELRDRQDRPVSNSTLADQRSDPRIGMTPEQVRNFSISRLALSLSKNDASIAPFEREMCGQVAMTLGRTPQGAFLPWEVLADGPFLPRSVRARLAQQRTVITTTASGGGNLVATDHLADSFVEMLYAATITGSLGATILDNLVGDVSIPTRTAGATVNWVAEDGASTEDATTTFGTIPADPKTMTIDVPMSRHMLQQATPALEGLVRADLFQQAVIELDDVALEGGGTNEPTGILNTGGIGSVVAGDAAISWDDVVNLEREVAVDNALMGSLAYATNPQVVAQMKRTFIDTGSGLSIWDRQSNATPVNGYAAAVSTLVPNDLGVGSNRSACIFGNWADLVICMWGTMDLIADPWTDISRGRLHLRLFQDVDVVLRHVQSFAAAVDIDHAA